MPEYSRFKFCNIFIVLVAYAPATFSQNAVVPLPHAHSHNDYQHERPLVDALTHGFCSVETDIFLADDQLLVGHDKWLLKQHRTLKKLYLDPLATMVRKNSGRVYKDGPMFTLLIDFKASGEQIYPVLKRQLEDYREMISGFHGGKYESRAIQIIISGACPRALIAADTTRLVSIDGRLGDLDSQTSAQLIPLISDHWGRNFKWRGKSPIKGSVKDKLKSIVDKAHADGRRVRFWATPESAVVWDALLDAGVDHINTDQLEMLKAHLLKREKSTAGRRDSRTGGDRSFGKKNDTDSDKY